MSLCRPPARDARLCAGCTALVREPTRRLQLACVSSGTVASTHGTTSGSESSTGRLCVPRVASSAKPIARPFDSSRTTVRACVRSAWSYRACWRRRPAAKPAVPTLLCFFVHTCIVTAFELPRPKSIAACRLPQPDPRTSRVRKCASPQPPGRGLPSFFICQHV
jgi:hypothetical protein